MTPESYQKLPDCPDCRNDELYLFGDEIRCYCCRFAAPKQDYSECFGFE